MRVEARSLIEFRDFLEAGINLFAEYEGNSFTIYQQTVPFEINQNGDIDSATISGSGTYFPQSCEFKIAYEVRYEKLTSLSGYGRYYSRADECEDYNYSYASTNEGASITKSNVDYTISNVKYYPPAYMLPHDSIDYNAITATREDCILRINSQRVFNNVTGKLDSIVGAVVPYQNYVEISIRDLERLYEPYFSSTIRFRIPK